MLFIGLMLLSGLNRGFAQNEEEYESSIADCIGAVEVTNYEESNIQLPGNFGTVRDLEKTFPENFETNSVWLKLEPNLKGEFGFEISSEASFDFNYYLYKDETGDLCNDLLKGTAVPIRKDSLSVKTKGLKKTEEANADQSLKNTITTEPLDVYYLLIHSNSSHTGIIKVKYSLEGDIAQNDAIVQDYKMNSRYKALTVRIRDKNTGAPVDANLSILGMFIDDKLYQGSDFIFDARPSKGIEIVVNAKGYFLEIQERKYQAGRDNEIVVNIEPLRPGKKLKMVGLRFLPESKEFLPISKVALKRLLDFMVVNSDTKIEIQGHVNAPGYGAKSRVMKLSEERAKMAYKYLIENGISKDRVQYKGFGNTQMIYPNPSSLEQEDANRRVEIMIIK